MLIVVVPAVAVAVVAAVALVLRSARRDRLGRGVGAALPLVPSELADAHGRVVAFGDAGATRAADAVVVDVAIVLAGRPAKGGAQRRYVHTRTDALLEAAADLQERHDALAAARAEVDELSGIPDQEEAQHEADSALSKVFFVLLLPAFVAWDGARAVGRGVVALYDGVVLRVRATGRIIAQAARRWRHVRAAVVTATRQARRRFVAARLRTSFRR